MENVVTEGQADVSKVTPTGDAIGGFNVTSFQDVLQVTEQAMLHMDTRQRVMFLQWFKKVKNKLDFTYPLGYRAVVTPVPAEKPLSPTPPASTVVVSPEVPPMPEDSSASVISAPPEHLPEPTVLDPI
jgi:hypothetical protein